MGLSRNKVAVSEGAAGSPPFYGESGKGPRFRAVDRSSTAEAHKGMQSNESVVQFSVTVKGSGESGGRTPGGVAQMGEHLPCKQGVRGSIPLISTEEVRREEEKGT